MWLALQKRISAVESMPQMKRKCSPARMVKEIPQTSATTQPSETVFRFGASCVGSSSKSKKQQASQISSRQSFSSSSEDCYQKTTVPQTISKHCCKSNGFRNNNKCNNEEIKREAIAPLRGLSEKASYLSISLTSAKKQCSSAGLRRYSETEIIQHKNSSFNCQRASVTQARRSTRCGTAAFPSETPNGPTGVPAISNQAPTKTQLTSRSLKGRETRQSVTATQLKCKDVGKLKSHPRIMFLDLDNTLIPTTWMMSQWRSPPRKGFSACDDPEKKIEFISHQLASCGLYLKLEQIFRDLLHDGGIDKISIVTNAGCKTVESFYLTMCMPELKQLLEKYDIGLHSTEPWVSQIGPPPNAAQEDAFRDFYTDVKFLEFNRVMEQFLTSCDRKNSGQSTKRRSSRSAGAHRHPPTYPLEVDVLSAGDQMCEITAACRLAQCHSGYVRLAKLLIICDPTDTRFGDQTPHVFVEQLESLRTHLLHLVENHQESVDIGGVVHWIAPSHEEKFLTSVAKPERFIDAFPRHVPMRRSESRRCDESDDAHSLNEGIQANDKDDNWIGSDGRNHDLSNEGDQATGFPSSTTTSHACLKASHPIQIRLPCIR